jgi:hypothetical protein
LRKELADRFVEFGVGYRINIWYNYIN